MLSRLFIKKETQARLSPQARALLRISDLNVSSANCTLIQSAEGEPQTEDLGRAFFFKTDGQLMIRDRALFITTPDGIKAENRDCFQGKGEILRLWFLYERVPRVIECRVADRVRFAAENLTNLAPKIGIGYKVIPVSDIIKQDKRSSLRFSHQPGAGSMRVYPQILFDAFVCKTNLTYPTEGAILPRIEQLGLIPPIDPDGNEDKDESLFSPEELVRAFKKAMVANPPETRTVHASKPYMEERYNRSVLIELGFSDVLGLGSEDIGRTLHIKKPIVSRTKDRRDPNYLMLGDTLVLHYGSKSPLDGRYEYYELATEISKGGLENITIRPIMEIRREQGFRIPLLDFCVNGVRFGNSREFMDYILGKHYWRHTIDEQLEALQNQVLLFTFYPRLRFTTETELYRPNLPKRISILGKIVRSEVEWENEEEKRNGWQRAFGVKFMYDPAEYARDTYTFDRWEMIRPFKENRYFKEVHKTLNGLIAYLESHTKE